jgi:hypothetical protein
MLARGALRLADGFSSEPAPLAFDKRLSRSALALVTLLSLALALVVAHGLGRGPSAAGRDARKNGVAVSQSQTLPLAAQAPVSAAVGGADPAYWVAAASRGGLIAASPGQHLRLRFGRAGVSLRTGPTDIGLRLQAVGFGTAQTALGAVSPRAKGNRVVFQHAGLSEWYVNGPLGLEQGFTVPAAPARGSTGPLTLSIALSGNARATLAANGQSVRLAGAGGPTLTYGGLRATDARGRVLRSSLALSGGRIVLRVHTRGASYPLRIDPFIHQGEKLTGSGLSGPYGYVGMSVALSADGNTALVGAPADGTYTEYKGAAFVFTRSGSTWTQQGEKLTGGGEAGGAWFGESVALSADGNTALIGGPSDNGAVGAAWIFTRSGSTWTQQGEKLTGAGEVGEGFFGKNVALSADGTTALVGGYNDNEHRGAAWVFTRSGSTWTQQGSKLTGGGEPGFFGWGVALSGEGNTALIGEWGLESGVGAAWVFTRSGATWTKQGAPLTALGESGYPWFGYSVALSSSGATALIGAPHAKSYAGAGWVFTRSGSSWTEQGQPLTGGEELGEGELGYSAALSASGDEALLGGRVDNGFHGAAWAFHRSGSTWAPDGGKLTADEETSNREEFGWSVALSSTGDTALVGSPCDKACVGSASAFVSPSSPPEFGRCIKGAKGSGDYANSGCTSPTAGGRYEWTAGVLKTGVISSGAGATLEAVGGSRVTCTAESGTGRYAGNDTLGAVVLTFTGCARAGAACSSAGAHGGEVVSPPLEMTLGVETLGTSASSDRLGLDLSGAGGSGTLLQFTCGATTVSLRGSVIVPLKANKPALTQKLKFKASKGKQRPESFAGGSRDVLEESVGAGAYEQAGLSLAATQTGEETVEANAGV